MIPVVGAAAGRVAVWVTTSTRFRRLWRLLQDELLARFQVDVQEKYGGKGEHHNAHEEAIHRGDGSVHDHAGDARQGRETYEKRKYKHHKFDFPFVQLSLFPFIAQSSEQ
jgi:hypothetical protein